MVPATDLHADQDPERHDRFEPAGPFDSADIQRAGPPEFLQDADDLLLRRDVVPGDQHLGGAARIFRVDHLRVRDRVEAFHDLRVREEPLDPLAQGILRADEQAWRRSAGEVERIRGIDQHLGSEVLGPSEFDHVLGRRPLDREEQDLAVLCRLRERSSRRLASRLLAPRDEFRTPRAARADLHIVAASREPASQRAPDLAATEYSNLHAAKETAVGICGFGAAEVDTFLSRRRGKSVRWSPCCRSPSTICTSSARYSRRRKPSTAVRTGSKRAHPSSSPKASKSSGNSRSRSPARRSSRTSRRWTRARSRSRSPRRPEPTSSRSWASQTTRRSWRRCAPRDGTARRSWAISCAWPTSRPGRRSSRSS